MPPDLSRTTIIRSPGLLIAPFDNGAAVFDVLEERMYLVGPAAVALLGSDEPATIDELVEALADVEGVELGDTRALLTRAAQELTDLGLLGRNRPPEPIEPLVPSITAPDAGWTVGATHPLLDRSLAFCGPDPELIDAIDTLLASPTGAAEPTIYFGAVPTDGGGIDVIDDSLWHLEDRDRLLWQLPSIVNYTVSHSGAMVVAHAGAIRTPGGRIALVTGPINTGKSTLVAALVRSGCDYLGDESIGIDANLHAWAYPKPLTLDPTSQALVGLDPVGESLTAGEHRRPDEIRTDAVSLSGDVGPIDLVVHTAYRPDAPAAAQRSDRRHAIELLATNTLNLARVGSVGLATLCRVAETVPIVSVTHSDTIGLADRIVGVDADPELLVAGGRGWGTAR